MLASPPPTPWIDLTARHSLLRVYALGADIVVATKGAIDIDVVHIRGARTRTFSLMADDLVEELDAIARGERVPPGAQSVATPVPLTAAPDRTAHALKGYILGDDGLPDAELVGILARHVAERMAAGEAVISNDRDGYPFLLDSESLRATAAVLAADADLAANASTARQRSAAVRRLLKSPAVLDAIIDTPTGKLVESIHDGRAY